MPHKQTQAEWETEMSEKILGYIRHTLYLDLRYLEPALSVLAYEKKDGLLTFATDGIRLYYASEPLLRVFQTNDRFFGAGISAYGFTRNFPASVADRNA